MIGWRFPPNNAGLIDGPNNSGIDIFAGNRLFSVVREIIQNSLDAVKPVEPGKPVKPVKLCFSLDSLDKNKFAGFKDIKPHLEASAQTAQDQGLNDAVRDYKHSIKIIKSTQNVPILSIHDYNTTGLTGEIDEQKGSWMALIKSTGCSQKDSIGSLGSFGHGSKAPFAYSPTRSIFYFSHIINKDGKPEDRFQGKSILQSHRDPNNPNSWTQSTGFYGHVEDFKPLLNGDVPLWARKLRESVTKDTGTSIFIPYTEYHKDLYQETIIIVIANFFYAIKTGTLEVKVGGDTINKDNLKRYFRKCEQILKDGQNKRNTNYIKGCFKSINTILSPSHKGVEKIPDFGNVNWYIRIGGDVLEKRVGIARSSGMLITRRPLLLQNFSNVNQFDMFICVKDPKGSEVFKRMENPTHDKLELNRIGTSDRGKVERAYNSFTSRIRKIIYRYAELDNRDEKVVLDFEGLLTGETDSGETDSGEIERGNRLRIVDGPTRPVSLPSSGGSKQGPGKPDDALGSGFQGGSRQKKTRGGQNQSSTGVTPIIGTSPGGSEPKSSLYFVENFRVSHNPSKKNTAKLYFDSSIEGVYMFAVFIEGEMERQLVKFKHNDKLVSAIERKISNSQRNDIEVEFAESVDQLALVATLTEKNK